ncbi:unnamed protein product [Caenorhabditis sp. 36 PRJEB53466]|nr:unnamed protein product [Caenorhabditis sp. 36 PRJEB53466]
MIENNVNDVEVTEESIETVFPGKKRDVDKKNKTPPPLKFEQIVETGEISPAPVSVCELFKKYRKADERRSTDEENVNVGFAQLSSDEKNGFLRKLQMLTVGNKKSPRSDEEQSLSSAGKLLKKFVPSRSSTDRKHSESSGRLSMFGRSSQKTSESEKPPSTQRKQSARRLNFQNRDGEYKPETEVQRNRVVAAMTREYEKIVTQRGVPVPVNKVARNPRGSLETPDSSPDKTYSSSSSSSPEKFSSLQERTTRGLFISTNDDSPNKKRMLSRDLARSSDAPLNSSASWHGELPPRDYTSPTFSRKIFVGGVPWDITEAALKDSFGEFGSCAVEWPGQEARYRSGQSGMSSNGNTRNQSKFAGQAATGYVYMIFEDERAVAALLHECSQEIGGAGEWYFKIRAQRSKSTEIRQVQIIPWVTSDSLFCDDESILETGIEPKRTVFVGALHGMMTAQVLHAIMEDCFGSVECVQLDTDKFKYPIGSGRVTFREHGAYFKAIEIGYLHVHTSKFRKRVQIDPFLESTCCMVCSSEPAHCFCRNRNCFKYYCHSCWAVDHGKDSDVDVHVPVIVPSSASKAYPGPPRRSHLSSNSPVKTGIHSNQSSSQFAHILTPAFPMIVAPQTTTLSALYGYVPGNQQCVMSPSVYEPPMTPSSNESSSKRGSRTDFHTSSAMYTPVMSPQKNSTDSSLPGFYTNSAAFLTPPAYFGSPTHSSSGNISQQLPYYGRSVYYGYMAQPMAYDVSPNASHHPSFMCSPTPHNYAQ